jgi:hypothetical protein
VLTLQSTGDDAFDTLVVADTILAKPWAQGMLLLQTVSCRVSLLVLCRVSIGRASTCRVSIARASTCRVSLLVLALVVFNPARAGTCHFQLCSCLSCRTTSASLHFVAHFGQRLLLKVPRVVVAGLGGGGKPRRPVASVTISPCRLVQSCSLGVFFAVACQ